MEDFHFQLVQRRLGRDQGWLQAMPWRIREPLGASPNYKSLMRMHVCQHSAIALDCYLAAAEVGADQEPHADACEGQTPTL